MNISTLMSGLVVLVWIVVVGAIVIFATRAWRGQRTVGLGTMVLVGLLVAILLTSVSAGMVFIEPQTVGVVISAFEARGIREAPLQPGLRWIIPFAETVQVYSTANQTYTMSIAPLEGQSEGDDSIAARTADGQEIYVDASVIYHINPDQAVFVHVTWQDRIQQDLVRAQARGIIRDAVSQYGVEEVVSSKRFEMTQRVRETMTQKFQENGLTLADFVLRNITFSPEYAASVEQKQIAEQQAQQAVFVVESRKQEAEQARQVAQGRADAVVIDAEGDARARIIQAEAEAQALELINEAIADNPDLLTYQYISKLAPEIQTMLLPSNAPFVFPLPQLQATPTEAPIAQPPAAPAAP